jgi:metal-responsive CopG/Arc/MetJ family transcriptional regulator
VSKKAKTLITIRLDAELIGQVNKVSKRIHSTRSETIRVLLREALGQYNG